jgi:hypothetical protein
MARSISTIIALMDAEQAAQTGLSGLNSVSNSAIYTLWKYVIAAQIYLQETLWDIFKTDLETVISKAAVGTSAWLQDRVLKFQYDATTPQVVAVDSDYAINYTTIDATKRIITRCAINQTSQRVVLVKVAKSEPPAPLSVTELSSLNGYLDDILFAGVNYVATSLDSDKLYLKANIYYDGQYSATISSSVITAINTYLAALPFDGKVRLMSIVDAIQSVLGVNDVVLEDVAIRANLTAFASKTYLVQSKTTLIPLYQLYAGYIVGETTAGNTFTDTLTFTPQ